MSPGIFTKGSHPHGLAHSMISHVKCSYRDSLLGFDGVFPFNKLDFGCLYISE